MNIGEPLHLLHSIVTRVSFDTVEKKYTNDYSGWSAEDLLRNEIDALKANAGNAGIQKVISYNSSSIFSEYCGEKLDERNIETVQDKAGQVRSILEILKSTNTVHRDITPNNIMVMDGRLTLIDFTWAQFPGSIFEKEHTPPRGLGLPWRSPDGFDDKYSIELSMRKLK